MRGTCLMRELMPYMLVGLFASTTGSAQTLIGEEPALGAPEERTRQADIPGMSLHEIHEAGLKMFATPFRKADGYGDGPVNPADTVSPGGRPMLQSNGTFLRVNGLDSQSCLDCHTIVSADTVPVTLGIGGAGGIKDSVMFMTRAIDVADVTGNGFADFDGRLINPVSLFGAGAVQLVAKEMTTRLQQLKAQAITNPETPVELVAKGVHFGSIVADDFGEIDVSAVEGVDHDLVVRPFGRKGEFATVRGFDLGALMFHMGMQPIEEVGENIDADGDGVVNEVFTGEVSALEIFITGLEAPVTQPLNGESRAGKSQFVHVGCADCHVMNLDTRSRFLTYSFPEVDSDPYANIFYRFDLLMTGLKFQRGQHAGLQVPMFSDLKRHDMGPGLAESFHDNDEQGNREFITAKLWGVADTAPYLHDGRAMTLNEAIMQHGGEAEGARDNYSALSVHEKNQLLLFLNTLRNPSANARTVPPGAGKSAGPRPARSLTRPGR